MPDVSLTPLAPSLTRFDQIRQVPVIAHESSYRTNELVVTVGSGSTASIFLVPYVPRVKAASLGPSTEADLERELP